MGLPAGTIRDATDADLDGILRIYNDAVLTTTAVWDETSRSIEAQRQWFAAKQAAALPVLVAADGDQIAGFCSYGPFRAWYGYRFTVENLVYVAATHRGKGIAPLLLRALIDRARAQGMHRMVAGIEAENVVSIRLHESLGFTHAAHLHEVGFKFGRWLDLVLMELQSCRRRSRSLPRLTRSRSDRACRPCPAPRSRAARARPRSRRACLRARARRRARRRCFAVGHDHAVFAAHDREHGRAGVAAQVEIRERAADGGALLGQAMRRRLAQAGQQSA